ncbi:MAG: hypothetical protein CTY31_05130 [Hyphomicrobium sp.]|nr:MAG: hypothetical protein CTY39_03805 [Hyphomicrobium sp.]PPD00501.1 MAG: hypothetical protein CTY31_05130 [Hyphomicrobium sp.]
MRLPATYFATLVFFLAVDMVWLGFVAKDFYRSGIGHLMGDGFNIPAAFAFYLIYIFGIMMFAINPAVEAGDWQRAAILGTAFGFFCYATYDLTNLATLRDWPVSLAVADTVWGAVLTGAAAVVGYSVASRF